MKAICRMVVYFGLLGGLDGSANAQYLWGRDSGKTAICPGRYPSIAVDGNCVFVAGVNTNSSGMIKQGDPVIEKLDIDGRPLWSNGTGIRCSLATSQLSNIGTLPHFISCLPDGEGGAVVFWSDVATTLDKRNLCAQRFSATGERLWGDNGRIDCLPENNLNLAVYEVVPCGTNGLLAAWQAGSAYPSVNYANFFNWQGDSVWTNKVFPAALNLLARSHLDVCSDEMDGALFVSPVYFNAVGSANATTMVQRIDAAGNRLWGSGVALPGRYYLEADSTWPRVAADGSGGAVVIYNDDAHQGDLYAQRIDASGTLQWGTNGVTFCDNSDSTTVMATCLVRTGPDEWVAVWSDNRIVSYYSVYAQKLNGSGQAQWISNGLPVCTLPANQAWQDQNDLFSNAEQLQASPDGQGGVWISWLSSCGAGGYRLQHLDGDGNALLEGATPGYADGIPVTSGIPYPNGFSLALWKWNTAVAAWNASPPEVHVGAFYSGKPDISSSPVSVAAVNTTLSITNLQGIALQPGAQLYLERPGTSAVSASGVSVDAAGQLTGSFNFGEDWTARDSSRSWRSLACSADGANWIASAGNDFLYLSHDGGATWTTNAESRNWRGVASSDDGQVLAGTVYGGQICISRDAGSTWAAHDSTRNWMAVATSADGRRLLAAALNDTLYTSSDFGGTWTSVESSRPWYGVAISADGSRLIAAAGGPSGADSLVVSTDYGATWTPCEESRSWRAVASSADGRTLAAVVYGGQIYISNDGGETWTARDSNRYWTGIACSTDGSRMVACAGGTSYTDQMYISDDGGSTWTPEGPAGNWVPIACSGDGLQIAAGDYNGNLYTRVLTPETGLWLLTVENADGQTASVPFELRPTDYPPDTLVKPIQPGLQLLGCPFGSEIALVDLSLTNGTRGTTFFDGDNIMIYDGHSGTFSNYWLNVSGEWVDNNGPASNIVIHAADGFWYRNRGSKSFNWNEPRSW